MPRPPLPVGTAGQIGYTEMSSGQVRARANFRDQDGVVRPVTRYGPSKAAAERRLKEALRDRRGPAGKGKITTESKFKDVAKLWLEEIDDADLADGSRETYERNLNRHVLKALGELRMQEIDVGTVDAFLKAIRARHGASASKNAKTVTSLVLGMAARHGALPSNPTRDVARIKAAKKDRVRALTVDETKDLLERIDVEAGMDPTSRQSDEMDLADVCRLMLGTGVRIGEALAIRCDVIDLDAGVVEINATIVRITGKGALLQERAKTDAGWRVIAVPDDIVELLRKRLAMSWPCNELGLIFPTAMGAVRNPTNVQRGLRVVSARIGDYEWVTSHVFRKTVATRLDEAGLSARAIADHLGHARPSMTQDVYMGRAVASAEPAKILGTIVRGDE
jgi:integrase